jgi:hypothetical protein
MGLPYALGLALLTDVISDLVEVLHRRRLVVWNPPSTDPTPLAHSHERTALRMRLASRARETGHFFRTYMRNAPRAYIVSQANTESMWARPNGSDQGPRRALRFSKSVIPSRTPNRITT